MSVSTIAIHQDAAFEVALELTRLTRRLSQIAAAIPLPADIGELFEDRCAATPASSLYGALCAAKVELYELLESLQTAASADEVTLRDRHRRRREVGGTTPKSSK